MWSKTREHAEHICSIADSAILPIKHAYRIKISSAMSLDHMTSQNGKRPVQVQLHWQMLPQPYNLVEKTAHV